MIAREYYHEGTDPEGKGKPEEEKRRMMLHGLKETLRAHVKAGINSAAPANFSSSQRTDLLTLACLCEKTWNRVMKFFRLEKYVLFCPSFAVVVLLCHTQPQRRALLCI